MTWTFSSSFPDPLHKVEPVPPGITISLITISMSTISMMFFACCTENAVHTLLTPGLCKIKIFYTFNLITYSSSSTSNSFMFISPVLYGIWISTIARRAGYYRNESLLYHLIITESFQTVFNPDMFPCSEISSPAFSLCSVSSGKPFPVSEI